MLFAVENECRFHFVSFSFDTQYIIALCKSCIVEIFSNAVNLLMFYLVFYGKIATNRNLVPLAGVEPAHCGLSSHCFGEV